MKTRFEYGRPGVQAGVKLIGIAVLLAALLLLAVSPAQAQDPDSVSVASASLIDTNGEQVGLGLFMQEGEHVFVQAVVYGMPPGFHGIHLHETGLCETPDFTSAGPHYNPDDVQHPDHAGDFPNLLLLDGGVGFLSFHTDRFSVDEILSGDGSALIVHENQNNFANIPERYGDPDEETLSAGDSGARLACGVVFDPRDAKIILPGQEEPADGTIVEVASADDRFSTLVTALQAADLVETLEGEGPFTVFAPTNDAFEALPEGTLDDLLLPENQQQLADILLYHVVPEEVLAADVAQLQSADTVLGPPVQIRVENDQVFINDAEVILTDIKASNGVIHVIDAVLIPPD